MLVRQADMIVSYIPELPNGKPGLSSGVERELQHAHDNAKDVFVIWKPTKEPSPFVTQTANKMFRTVDEAMSYFRGKRILSATRFIWIVERRTTARTDNTDGAS